MYPTGEPTYPPRLVEVPGGRSSRRDDPHQERDPDAVEAQDERATGADHHGDPEIRPEKVAEARLKILNGYYGRRDIQRKLAERLLVELGA